MAIKPLPTDRDEFLDICDTFIYRLLNTAFPLKDIDPLILFRFFIRDLYEELKKLHATSVAEDGKETILRVYRGEQVKPDELECIKSETALVFALSGDEAKSILFETEADQRLSTKPFGDISFKSPMVAEKEVLFMPGSILRISQIDHDLENNICIIKLVLCSNDADYSLKQVSDYIVKTSFQDDDAFILMRVGLLLKDMGYNDKAEHYYRKLLDTRGDGVNEYVKHVVLMYPDRGDRPSSTTAYSATTFKRQTYVIVGNLYYRLKDYEEALVHFEH
ncbi:unnamed protein product [Didymodactylos carnosus]|uniref:Tetratricopeptide repeat protein n=1 Tax=Didymodactylos carnosus TaxID=1234261 RepID=A0A814WL62_9BILA|nr:unnamed protein product [Didymodactylos carnosus]CAF1203125.1 unnamed protein product [Didymodactylos carnosus]CAF3915061.1 unnamed protein product [Didymodactylos carnosus]CAF3967428.1 unnamed protein product [Didymodactylos carnosus]